MLTADTFHANLSKIVADAGGAAAVSGQSLAAMFDLFELLFSQYMPMYPTGKFTPGVHFLVSQGAPKPLLEAVQAGFEMRAGKRQLDANGMRKSVTSAIKFAEWWKQSPKFLATFARLATNMAGPMPTKASSRIRHSGMHLKPVKFELPAWLEDDTIRGKKQAGKAAADPAPTNEKAAKKADKTVAKKRPRPQSAGPKATMQDLIDAEMEFGDSFNDDDIASNTDLLIPSARKGGAPTPASLAKRGDAAALAEAAKAKLAEFEKAKTTAEAKTKPQSGDNGKTEPKAPVDPATAEANKKRALELARQKAAEEAKKKAAEIGQSKAKAQSAVQSKAQSQVSSRKAAVLPDFSSDSSNGGGAKAAPSASGAPTTTSSTGNLADRAKLKVVELAKSHADLLQRAKALEATQTKAAERVKALAAEIDKVKITATEAAKVLEAVKGKLAAIKAGKFQVSEPEKQKLDAKAKAALEAGTKAKALVESKTKEFADVKAKAQEIAKQRAVILSKAKAVAEAQKKAGEAAERVAKSGKSGASATVIESKSGAMVPGSLRRSRPATQPPIRPGSRAASQAAPPPPPPPTSPAAAKQKMTAKVPGKPAATVESIKASAAASTTAAATTTAAPTGGLLASGAVKTVEDRQRAEEQLKTIDAQLADPSSPYEAFRLFLQRISVLRAIDPDHDDIPSREFLDQLKDEIAAARDELGRIKQAADWAALFHVWLLSTYGARPYLILDSLTVVEAPSSLVAVGQKLSLLVVYPPFIFLCRRARGTGFATDPRISLLTVNPWATVPTIDPDAPPAALLKISYALPVDGGKQKEETITLRYADRGNRTAEETLQGLEEFLGDLLTIRSEFVDYVFDNLAKVPFSARTFDYYLAHMRRCAEVPTLPERVISYKNLLEGMLRDAIFWLRPYELHNPGFVQLLDLGLKHKLFDSADLRRRVMRIQTLFRPEDEQLPPGMLENAALDCKMIVMTLLDDLASSDRRDSAFDDTYSPDESQPDAVPPFPALEGNEDDFIVKTVKHWFGGEWPQP